MAILENLKIAYCYCFIIIQPNLIDTYQKTCWWISVYKSYFFPLSKLTKKFFLQIIISASFSNYICI